MFPPRRDPDGYHPFTVSHLNTACGLCARRRRHWLHTEWQYLQDRPLRVWDRAA